MQGNEFLRNKLIGDIYAAIITNNYDKLSALLAEIETYDIDLNNLSFFDIDNNQNDSFFIEAVKHNRKDLINLLISRGANVNLANSKGVTPLHYAAQMNFHDILDNLLDNYALVDIKNDDGQTALHLAALFGDEITVKKLIEAGSNLENIDNKQFTPLYSAILRVMSPAGENLEVIYELIAKGADIKKSQVMDIGPISLLEFAEGCHANKAYDLLKKLGADVHNDISPLNYAISNNHIEIAKKLITHGYDVGKSQSNGLTALHIAVFEGKNQMVDILLANNANPNQVNNEGKSPLHIAAYTENHLVIPKLVAHGARLDDEDKIGLTAIFLLLNNKGNFANKLEVIYELIALGADFRTARKLTKSKDGKTFNFTGTPYEYAKCFPNNPITGLLEKLGAHEKFESKTFTTPVHYITKKNDVETLDKLLAHKFLVDSKDYSDSTALHTAAFAGNITMTKKLLSYKANINAKNNKGLTPILFAVNQNHQEMVRLLVDNGADIHATSNTGKTVLHQAKTNEMKALLLDLGANPYAKNNDDELAVTQEFLAEYNIAKVLNKAAESNEINSEVFKQNVEIRCLQVKYDNPLLNDDKLMKSVWESKDLQALNEILNNNQRFQPINNDESFLPHTTEEFSVSIIKNIASYLTAQLLQPILHYAKDVANGDNKEATITQYYYAAYESLISGEILWKLLANQATQSFALYNGLSNINSMLVGKMAADIEFNKLINLDFSAYTTPQYAQNTLKYLSNHMLATVLNTYFLGVGELDMPSQVLSYLMPAVVDLSESIAYQGMLILAEVVKQNGDDLGWYL
jgi:ankyrin repeat protein